MSDVLGWAAAAASLAAVLGALAWLAARVRRRGVGRDLMGPIDLIYRPHTHQINAEIRADEQRMVAIRPADDEWDRDG